MRFFPGGYINSDMEACGTTTSGRTQGMTVELHNDRLHRDWKFELDPIISLDDGQPASCVVTHGQRSAVGPTTFCSDTKCAITFETAAKKSKGVSDAFR